MTLPAGHCGCFDVVQFGAVGAGDSAPQYCRIGGVVKMNTTDNPFRVANEHVAARLGSLVGLPVVPGLTVRGADGLGFVSLRYADSRWMMPLMSCRLPVSNACWPTLLRTILGTSES